MIKNSRDFNARIRKRLGPNAKRNVEIALQSAADLVRNEAVTSIVQNSRSGPTVKRRGISMKISAAGDPPASDTGFLASQISAEVDMSLTGGEAVVKSAAPYSIPLEFGTVHMAARPFMQPALHKSKNKIKEMFKRQGII